MGLKLLIRKNLNKIIISKISITKVIFIHKFVRYTINPTLMDIKGIETRVY